MTPVLPDCKLVVAYAAEGSEAAFRALVKRHVDLVFATALRQVGDVGLAEEISQNVFVAMARKAPRLGGIQTLAGWLHRTTILESKARIRSELRRRRREETAAELTTLHHQGASPLEALIPLLDEALLNLRDGDRLALVLRFMEDRSLRDVGSALGVDEDAARKRVSRALERLTDFFRRRGFTIPARSGAAALMASTAGAAPAGLAASASNSGLAAGGAVTSLNLVLLHFMTITKTQTAILCILVAAVPLGLQWQAHSRLGQTRADLGDQLAAANRRAAELEGRVDRARRSLVREQTERQNAENRFALLNAQRTVQAPPAEYRWSDGSPVVRVPKKFLDQLSIFGVTNRRGGLSERLKEVLQLTESEALNAQGALERFLGDYHTAQAQAMRRVEPTDQDLQGRKPEQARVFEISGISEPLFGALREKLFGELESLLGGERFKLFRDALKGWMPVDDHDPGMNTDMAVLNFNHRLRFYEPKPGEKRLSWSLIKPNSGNMSASMSLDEIPEIYRDQLQDWITIAQSQPSKE